MTPARKTRYALVSLIDMLRVYAQPYITVGLMAGKMTNWLDTMLRLEPMRGAEPIDDAMAQEMVELLEKIEDECGRSELLCTVTSSIEWFKKHYEQSRPTKLQAIDFIKHLTYIFTAELNKQMLFQVSEAERPFFETSLEAKTISAFPSASREIEDAGRCYALDQWTACVLHLMRALEFGIASLVKALNVTPKNPNWEQVLRDCEIEIEKLPSKDDRGFYSEVATTFRHFRGAWRNHAVHGHDTYDSRSGVTIFLNVREFFRQISIRLSE